MAVIFLTNEDRDELQARIDEAAEQGASAAEIEAIIKNYLEEHPTGGAVTEDQIATEIRKYIAEHPIDGTISHFWNGTVLTVVSASGTSVADLKGADGISPIVTVTDIAGGHRITITDKNGTKTVDVMDGAGGSGGTGEDVFSPVIEITNITGGHRLTITDANGTNTIDIMDGEDGDKGDTGRGITSVTRTSGNGSAGTTDTYTIKYTDNTTSTFTVYNGKNGADGSSGKDGTSVTHSWNGTTLTVTSASGTSSANLKGDTGEAGKDYVLTSIDKAEIANMVENATFIEAPLFVDSVDKMTDTTKVYGLESTNTIWRYMDGGTTLETVTEQIVGTTDNPWGAGRLSSGNPNGLSGFVTTPYIDLQKYNTPFTLHLEGIPFNYVNDNYRFSQYNTDKSHLTTQQSKEATIADWFENTNVVVGSNNSLVITFTPPVLNMNSVTVGYARFSGQGTEANANVYITYEAEVSGKAWVDTGVKYSMAFDEEIVDVSVFNLANPSVNSFMDGADYSDSDYSYTNVNNYTGDENYRKDMPFPIIIGWNKIKNAVQYAVTINSQTYYTTDDKLSVYNLIPNVTYSYTIRALCADGSTMLIKSGDFTTASGTRMLHIDGIQNVRDIGGYVGYNSKTVKYGLIYRGTAMDEKVRDICSITDEGKKELLSRVGIKTDLDLRGANNVSASVLGSDVDFFTNPYSYQQYASAVTDATHRGYFKAMLEYIVTQLTANKPIYIHCSGGCDRTGTLVFLLLGLLGVSESDLAKEYELSSFSDIGGGTRTRNSATYDYKGMVAALKTYSGSTITDSFASFATACGISSATITSIRNLMLG